MPYTPKASANLAPVRPQTTAGQRNAAPEHIHGRANRGAWVLGFQIGASGAKANCPYAVAGQTVVLRRSWMHGWEAGAKSRFNAKAKKEPSRA